MTKNTIKKVLMHQRNTYVVVYSYEMLLFVSTVEKTTHTQHRLRQT